MYASRLPYNSKFPRAFTHFPRASSASPFFFRTPYQPLFVNNIQVKALVHHVPTEEDISDLLKEFTVDFLLKGYSTLVEALRKQLLEDAHLQMDKSHFLWLITYFLKFAAQLEVEMELIG